MAGSNRTVPWTALKHRNYRLLWLGNTFSQFGDHMQQVAQYWLVWQITGSISALGLAAFVGIVPRLAFGFFGGPLVDSHSRRHLLAATQGTALLFSLLFALSTASGIIVFWLALLFIFSLETTQIINQTTRQALLQEIVPREHVASAVSLNATGNNLARMTGPALGGVLIPLTGVSGLMFINSLTFLGILIAVWLMKLPEFDPQSRRKSHFKSDLKEGYQYIWRNNNLRMLIYLGWVSALLIMSFINLLPAYVSTVLQKGPQFLGFLTAAFGVGAVLGAMNSAAVRSSIGGRVTMLAAIGQGAGFVVFAFSHQAVLSVLMMLCLGISTIVYNNSVVTAMQLSTAPEYLGRVMGVYLLNKAVTALGALLLGLLSSLLGVGWAFACSGLLYLGLGAGVQYFTPHLRDAAISPALPQGKSNNET